MSLVNRPHHLCLLLLWACSLIGLLSACHSDPPAPPVYYDHGQTLPKPPALPPVSSDNEESQSFDQTPKAPAAPSLLAMAGGEIEIRVIQSNNLAAATLLHATYAPFDATPGPPSKVEKAWSFNGSFAFPFYMSREKQNLAMTSFQVLSAEGLLLRTYKGAEFEGLRTKARKGLRITLKLGARGTLPSTTIGRSITLPAAAPADIEYVALSSVFSHPEAILNSTDIDNTLEQLRNLATATENYHKDLLALVEQATVIDLSHLQMLLDAVYFNARTSERIELVATVVAIQPTALKPTQKKNVDNNLKLARTFAPIANQMLVTALPKITDLNAQAARRLLQMSLPATAPTSEALDFYLTRYPPENSNERLELLKIAHEKHDERSASHLALDEFQSAANLSAAVLFHFAKPFPPGRGLDDLLVGAVPLLKELSVSDARKLIALLTDPMVILTTAPILINRARPVTGLQWVDLVQAIPLGPTRDQVIQSTLPSVQNLTQAEAKEIFKSLYLAESQIGAAAQIYEKLPDFGTAPLMELVAEALGDPLRDGLRLEGVKYLGRKNSLTVAQGLEFTQQFSSRSARDACLLEVVNLATDLSSNNLPLIVAMAQSTGIDLMRQTEFLKRGKFRLSDPKINPQNIPPKMAPNPGI
ncbi:hypothetical protein WDW37_03340 [Bdellovibrionota bacterium FG-1]